jgi:hypothetical protein
MMMKPAITYQRKLFICLGGGGGGQLYFLTCMEFLFVFEFHLIEMNKKQFKYYNI